jgi:hypothetical protein
MGSLEHAHLHSSLLTAIAYQVLVHHLQGRRAFAGPEMQPHTCGSAFCCLLQVIRQAGRQAGRPTWYSMLGLLTELVRISGSFMLRASVTLFWTSLVQLACGSSRAQQLMMSQSS